MDLLNITRDDYCKQSKRYYVLIHVLRFPPKQKPLSGLLVSSHLRFGGLAALVHGETASVAVTFPAPRQELGGGLPIKRLQVTGCLCLCYASAHMLTLWKFWFGMIPMFGSEALECLGRNAAPQRFEIQAFQCSFQYVAVWAIHNQRPLVLRVWFSSILTGDMFLRARSTNSSNSWCRPCPCESGGSKQDGEVADKPWDCQTCWTQRSSRVSHVGKGTSEVETITSYAADVFWRKAMLPVSDFHK